MAKIAHDMYENKKREKLSVEGNVLKRPTPPKKAPKNTHEKHRERVRENFMKYGLETFQPHNVLEFLLFYSIPVKDTNKIAHNLINRFGSLSEVFDADRIPELDIYRLIQYDIMFGNQWFYEDKENFNN